MTPSSSAKYEILRTEELLTHVREGDQDAWREVYRRYRPCLTLTARSFAGLGIAEADDVVQACFLSAWSHIRDFEYRGQGSFRAWLIRIVVTKSFEFRRRVSRWVLRRRRSLADARTDSWWLDGAAGDAKNPSDSAALRDEQERLVEKMGELLTAQEQEVIILRYFEELPTRSILEVMEIPAAAARRLHRSAIEKMARVLGDGRG